MVQEQTSSQVLMVRQPVFGADLKILAYELLHDADQVDDETLLDPDSETSKILLNTYTSLSQDGAIRRVPLFISLSQQVLQKGYVPELPKKQVVLQIPAKIRMTAQVFGNIQMLSQQGYRLAVDGFALQPQMVPLLKYMRIIKLDIQQLPHQKLKKLRSVLGRSRAKLLAQNITNMNELSLCKQLKFQLYQGPFISRPVRVMGKKLPGNSIALLQLLQELQKPSTTASAIEELIILDPVLTYKILRVVNSAAYNLCNKIESLNQAVVLIGLDQVRKWATLIALSSNDDKPEELSRNMLVRGRLCSLLAENKGNANPETAFMVGILSQLDVLMGLTMEDVLQQVPLGDEIKEAIGQKIGILGEILALVEHHEQGDWDSLKEKKVDISFFEAAYRHSITWAQQTMQSLNEV
ncbi:MAG: HDOD domain-containing protein [Motiliproteus sp.]